MYINSITKELEGFLNSENLYEETNFGAREKALETIRILEEVVNHPSQSADSSVIKALLDQADKLEKSIHKYNRSVFSKYREFFQNNKTDSVLLRQQLNRFTSYQEKTNDIYHYITDDLDILTDGIFNYDLDMIRLPKQSSEFHHLERTPTRVLLDLIDHFPFKKDDVLYDFGSGLGHVVILINLLLGIKCVGIEIEKDYCELANQNVQLLSLSDVTILNVNILESTFNDGTIFFFYSPFSGSVTQQVLNKLQRLSEQKKITVCTFGPITSEIAQADWLELEPGKTPDPFKLAIYRSI